MIGLLVASLLLHGRVEASGGRFEATERMKELDAAWVAVPDKGKRTAAVSRMTVGVAALVAGNYPEACRGFDEARDILLEHPTNSARAVAVRFDPPFAEPRTQAQLHVTWAYMPRDLQPVRISVGSQSVVASPGRDLTINVRPEGVVTELAQSPESGVLVPVTVGDEPRTAYLSVVKGLRTRAKTLIESKSPEARTLAQAVLNLADGIKGDTDQPMIQMLFTAELLDEGRTSLGQLGEVPLVKQGATAFRIALPRAVSRKINIPVTVVIALSGDAGFNGEFFEADGQGSAVKLALDRGWVFASPATSPTAAADVLEWIKSRRLLKVARVFLIGHSSGAGVVLSRAQSLTPKPSGIALFSPTSAGITIPYPPLPVFVAVGKQDSLLNVQINRNQLGAKNESGLHEFDPCEHLMTVAEGIGEAYKFFDGLANK